jgi:hydrogenase nickel incorporation protein HypA/HybF
MHELGIVVHVIKQIEQLAKENNVKEVCELTLEVGEVSGVVKEYFVDAFEWSKKKTEYMKNTKLNLIIIEAISYCEDCKETYKTTAYGKECPKCGGGNTYLVSGRDVMIKEVKVI